MSCRDNNDGKKQKKDKGTIISSSDNQQHSRKGLDNKAKESNEGKKEKKAKGKTSGNNAEPSEEQQMGTAVNQNGGFDQRDEQKRQLNSNKKDKKS
ncbi:hypothetical protein MKX03_000878, partial [Papaver bracteatum]